MLGLYVHIPFCVSRCHYCDFVVTTRRGQASRDQFQEALALEAAHHAPFFKNKRFDTLYLGGGTPSALSVGQLKAIFSLLRKHYTFRPGAELTLEANPGDVDAAKAGVYRELGVNRISLGAQTFHDRTLRALNRRHSARQTVDCFNILRKAGFLNISLDLMLALPGESLREVDLSLKRAVALQPEHLSLYELVVEEKTRFGHLNRLGRLPRPDENTETQMLSRARDFLKKSGYLHYELLSYAKRGYQSRHNGLYWRNEAYLGLGPGAFSYFGGRRFRSSAHVDDYMKKTLNGDWSAYEEERLSPEARQRESLLLALRLSQGASKRDFRDLLEKLSQPLDELKRRDLLVESANRLKLTPQGQFFAESVFTELASE